MQSKVCGTHWMGEGKGPWNTLGKKIGNFLPLPRFEPRFIGCTNVASTDCTIPSLFLLSSLINTISYPSNNVFCNSLKRYDDVYSGRYMSAFRETCCQNLSNGSSETPVRIYQTTRRHIPEGCHLRIHHRVNLTSHTLIGNVVIDCTHISRQTTLTRSYPWQISLVSVCCFSCSK